MKSFCGIFTTTIALAISTNAFAADARSASVTASSDDPYLWLEDVHAARSMDWVKAQNAITTKQFMDSLEFAHTRDRILEVLDSDARIPLPQRMGDRLYNFWQDKDHPRGIWRSTTLEEYRKTDPHWDVLIDLDALNRVEKAHWVFKGADCLKPDYKLCLVSLSPGGGDAVEVREFDLSSKRFVKDGFFTKVAMTIVGWIDENTIYVATDFGPGSMTDSSYPRIVKEWKRGTPLSEAKLVYAGKSSDVGIYAVHDRTLGYQRDFINVSTDYFNTELYQRKDGRLLRVDTPTDADVSTQREWMLVRLHSSWTVGGTTYPSGTLLAARFDDFMAGKRALTVLFRPDAHTALSSYLWTRHHLILDELSDVQSKLEVLTPQVGNWKREPMAGAPALSTISVVNTDPDNSDEYWISIDGYLTPPSLQRGVLDQVDALTIKTTPAFFDASKFAVSQHFTASKDGTRIPYFEVDPKNLKLDGSNRTLLYGYGGFEDSMLPVYSGSMGRSWLERGGVYVVANIRGGGEYGPQWHTAALKAHRPRAYEDFAAVAQDLVARGVTTAAHLGAEGGSNGGLLMGNMLTKYPQLFGAIACEAPLLDMKRYSHLSAGASWIAEYGNPDTSDWNFIKTFSPYQNVMADTHYPPVLFYAITSDDRVGPAQARKMTARMEGIGLKNVWLYEQIEGGHSAGAENKQAATMHALVYDFLWDQLQ